MKRIEIRGVIVPSSLDMDWASDYINKGLITPESRIRQALASAGDDVELYINSRGGSVFSGNEMINAVKQFKATGKKLEITVGALAASMAANIIAMVGADKVRAHANTKIMFHGAQGMTDGGTGAHEDSASLLATINQDVVAALVAKAPKQKKEISGWFEEGRMGWLSAQQALAMGLIDEIIDSAAAPLAEIDKDAAQKMLEGGMDVAALDFQEPADTVARAELEALTARFTGLQSAKDKEIADLGKAHLDAVVALKDGHSAALGEKDLEITALKADKDDLTAKLAAADADLGKVKADLSAKQGELATVTATLTQTSEQLAEAKAKHAALVGSVLGGDPDGKKDSGKVTGLARMIAAEKAETESKKGA